MLDYDDTGSGQGPGRKASTAVYALTQAGARLARVLADQLDGDLFVSRRLEDEFGGPAFDSLTSFARSIYHDYSRHIFVAAAGIAVRAVAPVLRGKDKDPAVVAVDQKGRYAVSLVSGHLGGANELARDVAGITAGQAVVTTATDTEDLPSLDTLAQERGLAIANLDAVKAVNIALLAGEVVQVLDPDNWLGLVPAPGQLEPWPGHFRPVADPAYWAKGLPGVHVTHEIFAPDAETLVLNPPCLALGVGCRRGTSCEDILALIRQTLADNGLAQASILGLATITAKQDEDGLLEAAGQLGRALTFFDSETLKDIPVPNPSERVENHMGVASVCEAAALKLAGATTLLVTKTKSGNATVAVALVP